jgi:hypothetical protein
VQLFNGSVFTAINPERMETVSAAWELPGVYSKINHQEGVDDVWDMYH